MKRRKFLKLCGKGIAALVVGGLTQPKVAHGNVNLDKSIFVPIIMTGGSTATKPPYYVSPNGTPGGKGTRSDPYNLDTAVSVASAGETIICMQGIYVDDYVGLGKSGTAITIKNDNGTRPIFTHSDGEPPFVYVEKGCTVDGLWFSGSKRSTLLERTLCHGHAPGVTIKNCTFINYSQAITGGSDGYGAIYHHNRFINCGYGTLYHDIYVSHYNQPSDAEGAILTENIHVGGHGFKEHAYHDPNHVTFHANFAAGGPPDTDQPYLGDFAVQSSRHIVTNNIWWQSNYHYWNADECLFMNNIIGPDRSNFSNPTTASNSRNTVNKNRFCNGQTTWGSNPEVWGAGEITSHLGHTQAQIDNAISALLVSASKSTAQIFADTTIETNLQILRDCIDNWKNVT